MRKTTSSFSRGAGADRAQPEEDTWKKWLQLGDDGDRNEQRGAIVLVTARWVMIVVGIVLTLNSPDSLSNLQVSIAGILALAAVNFVLHTNLVMKRRPSETVLEWTSAGDIIVICAISALTGGVDAYAFVFFFPAILAYSLALPLRVTLYLTTFMVVLYGGVAVASSGDALRADPNGVGATLVTRLLTFGAVMAVANMYRWVEFRRIVEETPPAPRQRASRSRPRRAVESGIA